MPDPRVEKLAKVLVSYSLSLQPGEEFVMSAPSLAEELSLAVYKEAVLAGAHVLAFNDLTGRDEIFFKYANDAQLDYDSPFDRFIVERYTASLYIGAPENTRALSGIDPARMARAGRAQAETRKLFQQRAARGELKWCYTIYPTHAGAQEADMSLSEYQDFVYGAGLLDLDDPVAAWRAEAERQRCLIRWLDGRDQVTIKGSNVDVRMSIKGRKFVESAGTHNFPSGEIFTGPVESSVEGWVRFSYPGIFGGQEIEDIELWFEEGKVVREKAAKGQELLTELLNTDAGSRFLGEWGIGTNYQIQRFTKNMLFDEKIGGTIHFAVGMGYPESGSQNESAIHWDMLCDMADSEVAIDGDLFYKNGQFVV
ncbi:MAG: aminopeptidase [Anaerolineae bacterium]|nr:aminopeptidase [Anaerolineae bacterium]